MSALQEERLIQSDNGSDDGLEPHLRPARFNQFVGQDKACDNLKVFIDRRR